MHTGKMSLLAFYLFDFIRKSNDCKQLIFAPRAPSPIHDSLFGSRGFCPRMRTSVPKVAVTKMADVSLDELIRRRNFNNRGGLKRYFTFRQSSNKLHFQTLLMFMSCKNFKHVVWSKTGRTEKKALVFVAAQCLAKKLPSFLLSIGLNLLACKYTETRLVKVRGHRACAC